MRRSRRRFFEKDTDEERLIVRNRAFSKVHEILHNKQSSETDRTITSTRQTRNDDHDRHNKIKREQTMKSRHESTFASRKRIINHIIRWSFSSIIITFFVYNTFDHCWVSLSNARVEHEIKISVEEKNSKSSIWENLIVLRTFDKRI
jgi:hypothetical protein